MFRRTPSGPQILLVHPGGPFWAKKDLGAWSIPKGEYQEGEVPLDAARREFKEETGLEPPENLHFLGEIRQSGGKRVLAWAFEGDCNPGDIRSSTFSMEWPPKSGRKRDFPEVDRAEWFSLETAGAKILKGQLPFLERVAALAK